MAKEIVVSPCLSICSIDDDTGYCRGCYRTLQEVSGWLKFSEEEKKKIIETLNARREKHPEISER